MEGTASDAYMRWVRGVLAPIARANGLTGTGPVFRRRDGATWVLFALERRRIEPDEARTRAADPLVDFSMAVGVHHPATRPAWDDRKPAPPGMYDIGVRSSSPALEPPEGEWWHVFDADDPSSGVRLAELIRTGLPEALAALGRVDARALLERKLAWADPLENLAPGHAEELLALAAEAGAYDVRARIIEALRSDPVPDPNEPTPEQLLEETRAIFPGLHVELAGGGPAQPGTIWPPFPVGRRVGKTRTRLLNDLAGERTFPRRIAAARLGGWTGESDVVDALRAALSSPDRYTALTAACSLGHLGDAAGQTWELALGMVVDAAAAPSELGQAIVLLALLDPDVRRERALLALGDLEDRYPAWTRDLRGFQRHLA
ncbi:MAG: hypothetical protein WCK58_05525 [Chloroflexota bacterium]